MSHFLDAVYDSELQNFVCYIWSQWASDPCQEVQNADAAQLLHIIYFNNTLKQIQSQL